MTTSPPSIDDSKESPTSENSDANTESNMLGNTDPHKKDAPASEQLEQELKKPEAAADPFSKKLKHTLLKIIDLTALGFLEPIVRLCYGEEVHVQLKKIIRFVVVPILTIILFLFVWSTFAPLHKTKSGEVPTPAVVHSAWDSIVRFADRENAKEKAYLLTGTEREEYLADVKKELETATPELTAAQEKVKTLQAEETASKDTILAPLLAKLSTHKDTTKSENTEKLAALKAEAENIAANDSTAKEAYLGKVQAYRDWKNERRELEKEIKADIDEVQSRKTPALIEATQEQTLLTDHVTFLNNMVTMLGDRSREAKVAKEAGKLEALETSYAEMSGEKLYSTATRILSTQERVEKTEESTYAKPATFFYQIKRSIICVFVGFVIGSGIAIPIGVLCGLSSTFMAAMTPFIALFKPVSPIVWLPIALIVVGGFIPDPDTNPFIQQLASLPFLGEYKINPAFLASGITVALCSLWATMTNTALGVASVDKDHINVARVLRLGFWNRLFKIILPSALPLIFAGLRISLGVGWMVLIAAELLAGSEGIGKFVWDQFSNGASDSFAKMMVVVFVVGAIGLLLDRIMIIFQRLVSFEGSVAAI